MSYCDETLRKTDKGPSFVQIHYCRHGFMFSRLLLVFRTELLLACMDKAEAPSLVDDDVAVAIEKDWTPEEEKKAKRKYVDHALSG